MAESPWTAAICRLNDALNLVGEMSPTETISLDKFVEECRSEGISVCDDISTLVGQGFRIGRPLQDPEARKTFGLPEDALGPYMRWGYIYAPDGWLHTRIEMKQGSRRYTIHERFAA